VLVAKSPLPTVAAGDGAVFKGPQVGKPFTPTRFAKILFLNLRKSGSAIAPTLMGTIIFHVAIRSGLGLIAGNDAFRFLAPPVALLPFSVPGRKYGQRDE
jgi:hypothetical protein